MNKLEAAEKKILFYTREMYCTEEIDWLIARVKKLTTALEEIKRWTAGFGDDDSIPNYWRDELLWRSNKEAKKALEEK